MAYNCNNTLLNISINGDIYLFDVIKDFFYIIEIPIEDLSNGENYVHIEI
jgi:hypothetical protein